jgi:hypothetical protein
MANDIGWGAPYDAESGYGMAAVNGAESGYGNIVISSYSGETNISSQDTDNEPTDVRVPILDEMPIIYVDGDNMYVYFLLNASVTPIAMNRVLYYDGRFDSDSTLTSDGINWIAEFPGSGDWYMTLDIVIDSETSHRFTSNTLTV